MGARGGVRAGSRVPVTATFKLRASVLRTLAGMTDRHHQATPLLDLHHPTLRSLVDARGWRELEPDVRVGAVYDFVRNEIAFGYNALTSASGK